MSHYHYPPLVALSVVIACLAGYTALHMASHTAARARNLWTFGSAVAMGFGIWSMHFIAMLALVLPIEIQYQVSTVLYSLGIPVAASYLGMAAANRLRLSATELAATALIMGGAIAGMHYTGMAAIRAPVTISYDYFLVVVSVLIAVVASLVSLLLFRKFRYNPGKHASALKVAAGVVMGFAISGMHYTAMSAANFSPSQMPALSGALIPTNGLSLAVVITSLIVFGIGLGAVLIDRLRQASRAASETAEKLRFMIEGVKDYALFTLAADGTVSSWNQGAERLFGYHATEIIGKHLRELHSPEDQSLASRELLQAAETGRAAATGSCRRFDESKFAAEHTLSAVMDGEGSVQGFIAIVRDITEKLFAESELRRRDEQLTHSQKMEAVGLLAGGVAHDFNNILGAIRANAELLILDSPSDPDFKEGLTEIVRATDRATGLTSRLLAFSRKQVLQAMTVNPNQVIRGMQEMLVRLLIGDIEFKTELAEEVGPVRVDPAQLQQVMLNLVVNARDAMPRGGEVTIRTSNMLVEGDPPFHVPTLKDGNYSVISVADTGAGIASEIKGRIFEPFFTTKPLGKGTGLGLATVYGIVTQSGGNIWVESPASGGTIFFVCLPHDESPVYADPEPEDEAAVGEGGTLLLVDDEAPLRAALASALKKHGFDVLTAANGAEAIAIAEKFPRDIHFLLCDVRMPGMNGPEVFTRISTTRPSIKTLFMSGYSAGEIQPEVTGTDSVNFIQKPFGLDALLRQINRITREDS